MWKALIADDSSLIRQILRRYFEDYGCEVVGEAENPTQTLKLFEATKPNFVLLDIMMPKGLGIDTAEVFRQIRHAAPTTPIVIVSAVPFDKIRKEFIESGAFDFLAKPVEKTAVDAVWRRLKRVLAKGSQSQ